MKPNLVMLMNDPDGRLFPHLKTITPLLKTIFDKAFVSVPLSTQSTQAEHVTWLDSQPFYQAQYYDHAVSVGEDMIALYAKAAQASQRQQILHCCFIDRVAFALQSEHRDQFIADIQAVTVDNAPLIFQRSEAAWQTHPQNYRQLEQMITSVGALLCGKALDFAWCHLAIDAAMLSEILPRLKHRDLAVFAEMVVLLRNQIQTQDVDWLAWEDPFIYATDAQQLKQKREQSLQETRKRLAYVLSMLQLLHAELHDGTF